MLSFDPVMRTFNTSSIEPGSAQQAHWAEIGCVVCLLAILLGCLQLENNPAQVANDDPLMLAATAASIREFLDIRDGLSSIDGFRREDIVTMIETMCVM